jgi:hypothetical protein
MDHPAIEYSVIVAYLVLMLVVFKNFNKSSGDHFRGGSQGTWWIVGMSSFMAGISAFTFTGNGGAAFEAGWAVPVIYVANCIGLLLLFAPNPASGRLAILGFAAFLIGVGLFMLFAARRQAAASLTSPGTARTTTSSNNP